MAELFLDYSGLSEPEVQRIRDLLDPDREGAIDLYDAYDYSGNEYPFRCCDFDCLGAWDECDDPCCCRTCVGEEDALKNVDDDSLQLREEFSENEDTCCCDCGEEEITVLVFDDDCLESWDEYSECDEIYEHFPSLDCMCPTCFYDDDSFESSDDASWESDASGE